MSDSPLILALDISSRNTGICLGRPGEVPLFSSVSFANENDEPEVIFERALRWVADYTSAVKPDVAYIEAAINFGGDGVQTNANTIKKLIGLWAIISAAIRIRRIKYRSAKVGEVRKVFLGAGNLRKAEAKPRALATCHALGWNAKNPDEADSGALWHFAVTREAPQLAAVITPMLQHQIATDVDRTAMADAEHRRKRAIEIAEDKRRRAERKAERERDANALFKRAAE